MTSLVSKKSPLRLILDESVAFVGNTSGTILVRGEVIVNLSKDTPIHGPIDLEFEGIQRFYPWPGIMGNRPLGSTIETKLHVIELSLLPPNSQGIMPAGIQRFPFEFPLPGSLPVTLHIPNRMDIFYQLKATMRRQTDIWSSLGKKSLTATAPLRLVRAIEPIPSLTPSAHLHQHESIAADIPEPIAQTSSSTSHSSTITSRPRQSLDRYFGTLSAPDAEEGESLGQHPNPSVISTATTSSATSVPLGLALDEQHDRLAYSMAGRTYNNYRKPIQDIEHGVRYRLSIDRTAIAIGTSVGIEVTLEPMLYNLTLRSITARITETNEFVMKVPKGHGGSDHAETLTTVEASNVLLKWAYGYPPQHAQCGSCCATAPKTEKKSDSKKQGANAVQALSPLFLRQRRHWSDDILSGTAFPDKAPCEKGLLDRDLANTPPSFSTMATMETESSRKDEGSLLNLKVLDQSVTVGEFFEGRFVLPVPGCQDGLLHPSMAHASVNTTHWLRLTVGIVVDDKEYELHLASPVRLLDCRVVSADDERQTILPPPPSYEATGSYHSLPSDSDTFWVQRWPITQDALWGTCNPCPCEERKMAKSGKPRLSTSSNPTPPTSPLTSNFRGTTTTTLIPSSSMPPSLQPEWGPPPSYTEA